MMKEQNLLKEIEILTSKGFNLSNYDIKGLLKIIEKAEKEAGK